MVVIAAASMVMTAGGTAAAITGIICMANLRTAVIAARTAARTMLFHICHERILLSSEASASRNTLYPMSDLKKGF